MSSSARIKNKPIEILIVCNRLDVGGTERHLLHVLSTLDRRRFRVQLFVTRSGGRLEPKFRAAGISILSSPLVLPRSAQMILNLLLLTWRLRRDEPRIVHFFLPEAYILGGIAARIAGCRRRIMSRRSLNVYQAKLPFVRRIEAWLHKHTDVLLGNSEAVVGQLRAEADNAEKVGLIYNGIDTQPFCDLPPREEARRRLAVDGDALVLVIIANLIGYKGHNDLITALRQVRNRLPRNWVLLCVGRDDGLESELKLQAEALGLGDRIHWLGERDDVPLLLKAADIGVLCSHEEGFANSLLEGMAAGLPMIATAVGGNPEAVRDGVTGLLVPPKDPVALGLAISALAEDRPRRQEMGTQGRRRVKEYFSLKTCVRSYEKLYERARHSRARFKNRMTVSCVRPNASSLTIISTGKEIAICGVTCLSRSSTRCTFVVLPRARPVELSTPAPTWA